MSFIVAIDGPAGTGKGTVTSNLAKRLNLVYLDTGAMYRCVTLKFIREKIDVDNLENLSKEQKDKINELLKNINIDVKDKKIYLDGEDVSEEIRKGPVNSYVSQVSHIEEVRKSMVDFQRKISEGKNVILEGRDIGTNVFPNANVKIYLDASVDERVKRRLRQNAEKGIESSEEEVRKNIVFRDNNDKNASIAPLRQAEDAIYVDTSNLTINEVQDKLYKIVKSAKRDAKWIENGYIMRKDTPWKRIERSVIKGVLSCVYRLLLRVKVEGKENLLQDEGFIICANHLNYLDAAGIVLLNKQKVRFVGKDNLYRIPILSWLGHIFDIIPIKRGKNDMASIKMCLKALKNGEIIGIFPEGTRKGLEKQEKIKNGAVFLASKANVKIVPVGIKGNFKIFSKVRFNYGKPIYINEFKTEDDPNWIDKASDAVMNEIVKLTNE